ncbi:MAG: transporter substrate-binding domain-containing protein [Arcobacter sp.]|nr:transporter substrate-binding domain-containing protein [Arcobacter sp.]
MKIEKIIIILLIKILTLNLFADELILDENEKKFIEENKKIKIALMPDFSPFSYIENDRVIGFENDLLQLISNKTSLEFEKIYGVWNKNLKSFKEKEIDIITSISYKSERETFTKFTNPYYEIPIMIFVRDNFGKYEGIKSLEGKKVGILKDVFYANELTKYKNIQLVIYETYEEITKALVFGKIDALIQNLPNINYLIKKNLYSNLILADELKLPNIDKEDLRFGINPNKPELHSIIQKTLDNINKQEWQELRDRWIDVRYNDFSKDNNYLKNNLLTQQEIYYLNSKVFNYCINPQAEPFEYIDGKGNHNGITKDYLDSISKKIGMKTNFIKTENFEQTLQFLKEKKCEIAFAISSTPSNKKYLLFTEPYLDFPQVVATRTDVSFINDINDILDKKVAITKNKEISEILKLKYPNFKPIEVNNSIEGLVKVSNKKIDAFVDFLPTISRNINLVSNGNLKIAGKIDENPTLRFASRNDDLLLHSILQKSISSFEEHEKKVILDKWLTVRFEYGTDYSLLWKVILSATLLLGLFAYWNHKIRQAHKIIEKQNLQLEKLATTDKLTGIYNRTKLDELLINEMDRSYRYNHNFACAIIDIDYFKKVNDTYGHLVGDSVIKEIAILIKNSIRKSDYFGRWGGEEFLLILPEIEKQELQKLLEKIKNVIGEHPINEIGTKTVSIGATLYIYNDTITSIIKRADDALYTAKDSGRNKVVIE